MAGAAHTATANADLLVEPLRAQAEAAADRDALAELLAAHQRYFTTKTTMESFVHHSRHGAEAPELLAAATAAEKALMRGVEYTTPREPVSEPAVEEARVGG